MKKLFFYLIFLLISFRQSFGQQGYTLQDCVDQALKTNLDLSSTQLDRRLYTDNYFYSKFNRLPSVSLNGTNGFNSGRTIDPFTNQFVTQNIRTNNFSLTGAWTLFSGFQIHNTILRNRETSIYYGHVYDRTANTIILNVLKAFLDVISAEQSLKSLTTSLEQARSNLEKTNKQLAAGALALSAQADAVGQEAIAVSNQIGGLSTYRQAKLTLSHLMNITDRNPQLVYPTLPDKLAMPPDTVYENLYNIAEAQLPEIKAARENLLVYDLSERIAKGAYAPILSLNAQAYTGYSSARTRIKASQGQVVNQNKFLYLRDTTGIIIPVQASAFSNGGSGTTSEKYPFKDQLNDNISEVYTLSLSVPIFNNLRTRNQVNTARINRTKADIDLARAKQTLQKDIQQAILNYQSALARYTSLQAQNKALETAAQASRIRFSAGAQAQYDYYIQENQFVRSQNDLFFARTEYIFRAKILDYYAGKNLLEIK